MRITQDTRERKAGMPSAYRRHSAECRFPWHVYVHRYMYMIDIISIASIINPDWIALHRCVCTCTQTRVLAQSHAVFRNRVDAWG